MGLLPFTRYCTFFSILSLSHTHTHTHIERERERKTERERERERAIIIPSFTRKTQFGKVTQYIQAHTASACQSSCENTAYVTILPEPAGDSSFITFHS
jgi:hypothetical protein